MARYYNYREYLTYIYDKYNKSKPYYTKKFDKDESPEMFLTYFESMNVFPIYPRPIIMPLKKKEEQYDLEFKSSSNINFDVEKIGSMNKLLESKIKEFDSYGDKFRKLANTDKIRRFFSYEIIDAIKPKFPQSKITNAWVKMYELLSTYNLFDQETKTINTFHLCEHPGAFVYAVQDYVKKNTKKPHEFIFQSLKPGNDFQIFRPDPNLVKNYGKNLDYGPKSGDLTNPENIRYYINHYKKNYYNLITSDCGLDYSDDFTKQELGMYKIFMGAFITAVGLSQQGSHYIFKLFSFNDLKTIEMLQIACLFYEEVDAVRLLTDKSGSGEIYIVCCNFNYKGKIDNAIDILLKYMESGDGFILSKFDEKFTSRIVKHHQLLSMRRITNYNQLLFRFFNNNYADEMPEVKIYVKNLTEYYTNYFLTFVGLISNK